MPKRTTSPPPKSDNNSFRDDLKRQFITELVKSPIAIIVAVVTTLIVGFITFRPNDTAPVQSPPPTAVSVLASPIPFTPTTKPPTQPTPTIAPTSTTQPTTAPSSTIAPPSPTVAESFSQTANPDDYLVIEQNAECPSLRLLPDTLVPTNGILNSSAVFDAFFDLIKAPEVPKPASPLKAILTLNSKPENQNWLRLDHTVHVNIRATADIPDHSAIVTVAGCGGGADARDFEPIKLDSTYAAYQTDATFEAVDFFTLQPGEFEEFNIQFECANPGRYQIEINIPFRHVSEQGTTSNSLTVLCPKSYTLWDSEDPTGVTSTSYGWMVSRYVELK